MPAAELWLQASASSPIRQAITQRDPFVSRHQFRSPHIAEYLRSMPELSAALSACRLACYVPVVTHAAVRQ